MTSAAQLDLECRIDHAWLVCATTKDPAVRRDAFDRMRELIKLRTPERIRQMELDRGLRP